MSIEILIGSHVSMNKPNYLLGSALTAISYGANAFMIYTGAPQNNIRTSLDHLKINEFKQYLQEQNISLENVIVHAPYIINLATSNELKHHLSVQTL